MDGHLVLRFEDEVRFGDSEERVVVEAFETGASNDLLSNEERTMLERVDEEPFASWADRLRAGAGRQPRVTKESLYGADKSRSCTHVDSLDADLRSHRVPVADVLHTERFDKHFLGPATEERLDSKNPNAPPALNRVCVRIESGQLASSAHVGESEGGHVSLEVIRRPDNVLSANSDASSEAEFDFEVPMPEPPDGQYGWVVVASAFVCSFIASGVQDTFGLVLSHLVKSFDSSTTSSSIAGSIFWGLPMLLCPMSSALTNRFGCRAVTIAAGIVTFVGLFLSAFMPTIELFYLTYGVLAGAGFALVYIPSTVIVSFYFEKRRAFATGLSAAGSGIGIVVFGLITELLFSHYGVEGYLMLIAAFSLNMAAFGLFFRPLESPRQRRERVRLLHMEQLGHRLVKDPASLQHSMRSMSYLQGDVPTKIQLLERLISPQSLTPPEATADATLEQPPTVAAALNFNTHRFSSVFHQLSTLASIPELEDERLLHSALNLSAAPAAAAAAAAAATSSSTRLHRACSMPFVPIDGQESARPAACAGQCKCNAAKVQVPSNSNCPSTSTSRVLPPAQVPLSNTSARVHSPHECSCAPTAFYSMIIGQGGASSDGQMNCGQSKSQVATSEQQPQPQSQSQRTHHSHSRHQHAHARQHAHPHPHQVRCEQPPMPPTVWLRVGGRHPIPLPGEVFSRAILAPMCRRDILYRGTLERVPELRVCKVESCPELFKSARSASTISLRTGSSGSVAAGCLRAREAGAKLLGLIGSFIDLRVFGNRMFLLYFISSVSVSLFQNVPSFFLTEFARSNSVNELGIQWLYLIMGVCTSLGQILIGYVGDRPQVNTLVLHASTLLICGVSTTLLPPLMTFAASSANTTVLKSPFQTTATASAAADGMLQTSSAAAVAVGTQWVWEPFIVLVLFQLLFNFFISGQSALSTLLLVDFLSLEELTSACALIWCGDGVALIVGPPLLSLLAERAGNYNSTFIISGIALLVNSVLLMVIAVPSIRVRFDPNYAHELEAATPDEVQSLDHAVDMADLDTPHVKAAAADWSPDSRSPAARFKEMSDADTEDTESNDADADANVDADASISDSGTDHSDLTPEKTLSSSKY